MKLILNEGRFYVLRFDRGDEVIAELKKFIETQSIKACSWSGIGAFSSAVLSYYNLKNKKYEDHSYAEDCEIISLSGNAGRNGAETVTHAHGVFSGQDMKAFGGHVKELVVSVTCEVTLRAFEGVIEREYSEELGVNLLK